MPTTTIKDSLLNCINSFMPQSLTSNAPHISTSCCASNIPKLIWAKVWTHIQTFELIFKHLLPTFELESWLNSVRSTNLILIFLFQAWLPLQLSLFPSPAPFSPSQPIYAVIPEFCFALVFWNITCDRRLSSTDSWAQCTMQCLLMIFEVKFWPNHSIFRAMTMYV